MYGLEFHKADNALICASAEFEVRKIGTRGRQENTYYKIVFGPNGTRLSKSAHTKDGWETITDHAEAEDIEAILPKRSDVGLDWTVSQFMLALTFFGEGHKLGYGQGEIEAIRREHNRAKYDQRVIEGD